MKRFPLRTLWVIVAVLAILPAASEAAKLPKITGGGATQNFNSVTPYGTVQLVTFGGFTARAKGPGTDVVFAPFGVIATVYPARGSVQAKFAAAGAPGVTVGTAHGRVVCIANLGPSKLVDGDDPNDGVDADPDGDVWEIRFRITRAKGVVLPTDPVHGSFFVQDGGRADFADESFAQVTVGDPACANNPFFGLEPHLDGNIRVHP